ncbi:MAG: hypothetical protein R3D62_20535 [Xanthobacteraceae bacterium]
MILTPPITTQARLDHEDFGSIRSEVINVKDTFKLERDAGGNRFPLFLIPLLPAFQAESGKRIRAHVRQACAIQSPE